jgi:hypothetical protein
VKESSVKAGKTVKEGAVKAGKTVEKGAKDVAGKVTPKKGDKGL